jgi:hypothetical protein
MVLIPSILQYSVSDIAVMFVHTFFGFCISNDETFLMHSSAYALSIIMHNISDDANYIPICMIGISQW